MLFLAGKYDASLVAIAQTLKIEPMHYAALAGRGIILIQLGKDAEAQVRAQASFDDRSVAERAASDRRL